MATTNVNMLCAHCGSADIYLLKPQIWDTQDQAWETTEDFENVRCSDCGWDKITETPEAEAETILRLRADAIEAGYEPETDQSLQEFLGLSAFRSTHCDATAAMMLDDTRPIDLDHYPGAKVHGYLFQFPDEDTQRRFYIVEMPDGFHYLFMHPADEVAMTLEQAEAGLYAHIHENEALR